MAVQVWMGEKPEHPNERRTIVALANGLDRLDGLYLLLVNFTVGGRTVDLAIIKRDAIFIIELKHCDGVLEGGVNGPWYLTNANGERKQINPGRSNPYNQVISCYYSLTNFLNDHRQQFLSEHRAKTTNFRSCRRLVVIAPTIQQESHIELDWKVDARGLDELPSFLVTERSAEIDLTEGEMLAIPEMLSCTRWQDINVLMEGVLPHWSAETPSLPPIPQPSAPWYAGWLSRLRQRMGVPKRRMVLATTVVVLCLLLVLIIPGLAIQSTRQSAQTAPLIYATSGPAGGVYGGGIREEVKRCIWTEFQPVGKRWDVASQSWISVGVDGIIGDNSPEIVVTLEQVDYCDKQITFVWSVRNNSDHTVTFPLQSNNITIRDPLGNTYEISNMRSEPRILLVKPGEQQRGTMVVPEFTRQHIPSLLVRLREKPFGEASWLVSLDG